VRRVLFIIALAGCDELWSIDHVSEPPLDGREPMIDAGPYCFEDTFTMPAIDPGKWTVYADAPHTVGVVQGEAAMTLGTIDGNVYAGMYGNKTSFSGAMVTASVLEVPSTNGGGGGAVLVFQLARNSENSYAVLFDGGRLYFRVRANNAEQLTNIAYSATDHRFWGMKHDAMTNEIVFVTSSNSSAWKEERRTTATVEVADARVEIFAGTYVAVTSPGRARVDDVRFTGCGL